ncbi:hypothetical protein ABIA55_002449 [Pseudomonas frederiksbergensis]
MNYRATKDLSLQYYYGNLQDFYKQNFLDLKYDWQVGTGTLRTDLRHFDTRSDGANDHDPNFYTFGYYSDGVTKGKVDSRLSSAQFTYLVNGHTFAAGLQQVSGDSDAVRLSQGDGSIAYFMTESMIGKFSAPGKPLGRFAMAMTLRKSGFPA